MIKVSIIEDHSDFLKSLVYLLNATDGFVCVDSFVSAEDGIANLTGKEDVLLLDINLPSLSGIEAIPIIKNKFPQLKIIMLTIFDDDNNILEAILAGADGYLLKNTSPSKILTALDESISGGSPMTASIAKKVLTLFKHYIPVKSENISLTNRETEILKLLVEGLDNATISENLFISIQTVRNHIRNIYEKLHVHSKSQAVVKAIKERII